MVLQGFFELQFYLLILWNELFFPGLENCDGLLLDHLVVVALLCLLVKPLGLAFIDPFR